MCREREKGEKKGKLSPGRRRKIRPLCTSFIKKREGPLPKLRGGGKKKKERAALLF